MRVTVDVELCQANGQCLLMAPTVFELGDEDLVVRVVDAEPDEELRAEVEAAVAACPVRALLLED